MQAELVARQGDIWAIDLSAEDMTVESLDTATLLGTTGSFACGACASCPVSSASTAGTIGSA
ncbi:Fe-S cluster biogenesis protein NfuA [Kitasatospora sp. MAP12-15]|uniref:thiocillin family RiPP n=1 Tax=unclassified Kitasatospora TaxID=2633591 RepID=UPI0024768798|nr:thiocillin family RiPP [Kitasatospora sp. MAP12-44]MDH6114337.1 Fe-S cluster biogenesis protein NfuA [Kitasatospora sp. MAP12-44]